MLALPKWSGCQEIKYPFVCLFVSINYSLLGIISLLRFVANKISSLVDPCSIQYEACLVCRNILTEAYMNKACKGAILTKVLISGSDCYANWSIIGKAQIPYLTSKLSHFLLNQCLLQYFLRFNKDERNRRQGYVPTSNFLGQSDIKNVRLRYNG